MPRNALVCALVLAVITAFSTCPALAAPGQGKPDRGEHGRPDQGKSGQNGQRDNSKQGSGNSGQQGGLDARQAAAKAQAQYGGRVLKVSPEGNGYRVRLLRDDGRVITVSVER